MSKTIDSATQINDLNNSLKDIKTTMDDPSSNSKGINYEQKYQFFKITTDN